MNVLTVHNPPPGLRSCSLFLLPIYSSLPSKSHLSFLLCFHLLSLPSRSPCHLLLSCVLVLLFTLSLCHFSSFPRVPCSSPSVSAYAVLADLFLQLHILPMFSFILFSHCCLMSIFCLVLSPP